MVPKEQEPDSPSRHTTRFIIWVAVLTSLCVGSPLSLPFWHGLFLHYASSSANESLNAFISVDTLRAIWQPSVVLGAVVWGVTLGWMNGIRPLWRMGLAGGIGVFLAEMIATNQPFIGFHRALWPDVPAHVRGAMDLVFGVGVGGGVAALAIGLAIRWERRALWLGLGAILAASIPALIVDLILDAIGIRWGAGNANMAKVVGLAFPCSTAGAGILIGWYLARFGHQSGTAHPARQSAIIHERDTQS